MRYLSDGFYYTEGVVIYLSFIFKTTTYNMAKTLKSGQVFRYIEHASNVFQVFSRDKVCWVRQDGDIIKLKVSDGEKYTFSEEDMYWKNYFGFADNYSDLEDWMTQDPFLAKIYEFNRGLRLLHQDPWETLISFIVSQQKRIPQIQTALNRICELSGRSMEGGWFAFPTPEEILSVSIERANLGYRLPYVLAAAEEVVHNGLQLERLQVGNCNYKTAMQRLCAINGVGVKVANCVCLFGLGYTQAFPVDVHIQRVLDLPEMKGFSSSTYGDYAGIVQQYLYNYALYNGL